MKPTTPTAPASLGLLVLRIAIGIGLMHHGFNTLFGAPPEQPPAVTEEAQEQPADVEGQENPPAEEEPAAEQPAEEQAPAAPASRMASFTGTVRQQFPFLPEPEIWAFVAKWSELAGGALLVLGLLTRVAAFLACCVMGFAIYLHAWINGDPYMPAGAGSWELASLYGAATFCLLFTGGGRLSVDRYILGGSKDQDAD